LVQECLIKLIESLIFNLMDWAFPVGKELWCNHQGSLFF